MASAKLCYNRNDVLQICARHSRLARLRRALKRAVNIRLDTSSNYFPAFSIHGTDSIRIGLLLTKLYLAIGERVLASFESSPTRPVARSRVNFSVPLTRPRPGTAGGKNYFDRSSRRMSHQTGPQSIILQLNWKLSAGHVTERAGVRFSSLLNGVCLAQRNELNRATFQNCDKKQD